MKTLFTTIALFAALILLLTGLFYALPLLFEKTYPITNHPELTKLNEKIKEQGYLTEDDVNKMNTILKRVDDEERAKIKDYNMHHE